MSTKVSVDLKFTEDHFMKNITTQIPKFNKYCLTMLFFVFSGDHDMAGPYMGTLKWIWMLNLTVDDDWRPWHINGQVAGLILILDHIYREIICYVPVT